MISPSDVGPIIQEFVHSYLPTGAFVQTKPVNNYCMQITVRWQGKSNTGFLVAGHQGFTDREQLFALLKQISDNIPGIRDRNLKSEGVRELMSKKPQLGQMLAMAEMGHDALRDFDDYDDQPDIYDHTNFISHAETYFLKVIGFPFTDQQLEAFCKFSSNLAKSILEDGKEKFDSPLLDICEKDFGIDSQKERVDLALDTHAVLKELEPAEFVYWMKNYFSIEVEEGMKYDTKTTHFFYF